MAGSFGPDLKGFNIVKAAVIGGTASKLGGGKFDNGAVSGAFTHLFSSALSSSGSGNKSSAGSRSGLGNALRSVPVFGGILGGVGDSFAGLGNLAIGNLHKGFAQMSGGMARIAGNIWALPNTSVGLVYGSFGVIFGANPVWNSQDAILYLTDMPDWLMPSAMSLGHVHVYGAGSFKNANGSYELNRFGLTVVSEETLHTRQAEYLGPFYLPLHALSMGVSWISSGHTHNHNLLEMGPERGNGPWPWN